MKLRKISVFCFFKTSLGASLTHLLKGGFGGFWGSHGFQGGTEGD